LDLETLGIDPSETGVLSNRLRSLLVNIGNFEVVERSRMEEVLSEQGLQQSGCTSDECVVEVGKLLGVQKMLAGSFGKFGNVYTLELRIIDVQTGKIESSTNYDYQSEIENLLLEGAETALRKLLSGTKNDLLKQKRIGSIKIITNPDQAAVMLDGTSYNETPLIINNIDAGEHDLVLEKNGYLPYTGKIKVEADSLNQFVIDLKSQYAYLEIKSLVEGAELFINYQSVGKNKFIGEHLEPGTYFIEVKHDFYNSYTEELKLEAGDRIFKEIDLSRGTGELMLKVKPKNISLILSRGEDKSKFLISKPEQLPLDAGIYSIELNAVSYYPYKDKIKINTNEVTPVDIELRYGGDDLNNLKNQRKWLNITSGLAIGLAAGSLLMANSMYSKYKDTKKSSDAENYKSKTELFTFASYGFSAITVGVSLYSIKKWWKINNLKEKLGLK
ncbi:MAG: PEGA domain-containing protein, partial [Calditrichaceae bacterium]